MKTTKFDREAMYYKNSEDQVICTLCPHYCVLKEMEYGRCGVRQNIENILVSHNYGLISAIAVDPIAKKPLIRFMQGSQILSIGSIGCNLSCSFCQNSDISKTFELDKDYKQLSPQKVVDLAIEYKLTSIAYTYNEPTVFYEMVLETSILAHKKGIKNVLVTNGFINRKPMEELLPYIDAMNIDVKTYDPKLYIDICGGRLTPVLNTIALALKHKVHIELTCLIVPVLFNDLVKVDDFFRELRGIAGDVVIHITRYFPSYLHDEAATKIEFMLEIQKIAFKYFTLVKLGNIN